MIEVSITKRITNSGFYEIFSSLRCVPYEFDNVIKFANRSLLPPDLKLLLLVLQGPLKVDISFNYLGNITEK